MNESHNYMRISKYPLILNNQNKVSGEGIGPHIDFGFLTILLQYKVQGLEIKDSNGQWFQAPIIPGTFLINIENMIQRLTNDYFRATVHRVVLPKKKTRLSISFFFEPNYDMVIEPIEKFCTENNPIKYTPLHFGDYPEKTFKTSYSDINVQYIKDIKSNWFYQSSSSPHSSSSSPKSRYSASLASHALYSSSVSIVRYPFIR